MMTLEALRAAKIEAEDALVACVPACGPDYDDPQFQAAAATYKAACAALAAAGEALAA